MSATWLSSPKLWMAHSDLSHTWLQRRRWLALPATWGNWYATADEVLSRSLRLHACWTRCPVTILEASVVATMCLKTCSKGTPAHLVFVNLSGVTMAAKHGPGASKVFSVETLFYSWINLGSSAVTGFAHSWAVPSCWLSPTPYREKRCYAQRDIASPNWPKAQTGCVAGALSIHVLAHPILKVS